MVGMNVCSSTSLACLTNSIKQKKQTFGCVFIAVLPQLTSTKKKKRKGIMKLFLHFHKSDLLK